MVVTSCRQVNRGRSIYTSSSSIKTTTKTTVSRSAGAFNHQRRLCDSERS
ncbi:hypothetical protein ZHAS_00019823 [Anopheles sinensis]|uniref:Uncharacterized protein n=1 Tax=Anopheles sinensis TaxID=74873 RepID=A0A084WND8_ANOSI|nr:hypothetical protein ZHAS_00019823 [Anopheles sinensis]